MSFTVHTGDAVTVLRSLAPESVNCVVTSPPYWGLRDYGVDGQLGLERSIADFIANLVAVFREVRRVLRKDGTCWVNMGDSYVTRQHSIHDSTVPGAVRSSGGPQTGHQRAAERLIHKGRSSTGGLRYKDMIGQPWRLAFALQADGWILRRDIIWHKPAPMPESCRDRPTTAHEYLFLLVRSPRYFYDAEAITEPCSALTHLRVAQDIAGQAGSARAHGGGQREGRAMKSVLRGVNPKAAAVDAGNHHGVPKANSQYSAAISGRVLRRNKRSVWKIAAKGYRGAHFATFPPKLVEPCVLAGCPEGGIVLDPFAGSGTTGEVALQHGRRFVGIELNPAYADMARERCERARRAGRQLRIAGVA